MSADGNGQIRPHDEFDTERVEDVDELSQRARMRELYETRRDVRERRRKIHDAQYLGGMNLSPEKAATLYRDTLGVYLRELHPLITKIYEETGKEYWEEYELGSVEIQPPEEADGDGGRSAEYVVETGGSKVWRFDGLKSIFEAPESLTAEFEVTKHEYPRGRFKTTVTASRQIPFHILDNAYTASNEFLADIGLDLDPDEGEDEYNNQYNPLNGDEPGGPGL